MLRKKGVSLVAAALLVFAFVWWNSSRGFSDTALAGIPEYGDVNERSILAASDISSRLEPSYLAYYRKASEEGATDTKGRQIVVRGAQYAAISREGASVQRDPEGLKGDVAALNEEGGWVEYEIDIAESGFYQMGVTYYALKGKGASIQRSVSINGEYPFFQSKRIVFQRMWKEAGDTRFDEMGNEFNPRQEEAFGWQYRDFRDPEGRAEEPFRYYLAQGKHRIRIEYTREPAAIGELRVFSPVVLPTYAEVLETYKQRGYKEVRNQLIKVQAEQAVLKSEPTLRRKDSREPATEPFNKSATLLNTIGGSSWRDGGQWLEWEFEVPESGLYQIGTRFMASWLNEVPVQRTVSIDGVIPFQEMNAVDFPYSQQWQVSGLGGNEEPYLFYLEKGKHRLRMEVQVGQLGQVFERIQDVLQRVSYLSREIIMVVGTNPDPNREWELERNIPNLVPRLHLMALDLQKAIDSMYEMGTEKGSPELATIAMARDLFVDLAANTDSIAVKIGKVSDLQSSLGGWITSMNKQRLQLDYIVVKSADQSWPKATASFATKFGIGVYDFFTSFTKDYRKIGMSGQEGDGEEPLKVWVARGRDWAQIIKQLADEDFTANTGIQVDINVIPAGAMNLLMLAVTSGKEPDVALGVEAGIPIDFALRGGLKDLGTYPDYDSVAARFRPGALIPYRFQGGNYALPENQNFSMMFYRKDVLQELGITDIPQTWQDVMDMIPTLQRHGMDFFYAHSTAGAAAEFAPFLFQSGGDFYRDNGKSSALDTPEALGGMKMWTGLYTNYKISKEASFYNRFRSGEMPIGVADYSTYVQLMTAAPELTGWWEMLPMPGIRRPDGKIDRSVGGASQTAIIFKNTKKSEQAWAFLKWWTSESVQERFGTELEALMGVEARWNTANVEALMNLPWPQKDIEAILEQWEWFREREIVPGDYLTTRYINNIWNEIVLKGKTIREAMEDGVKEINRELAKKREEFGLDRDAAEAHNRQGGDGR